MTPARRRDDARPSGVGAPLIVLAAGAALFLAVLLSLDGQDPFAPLDSESRRAARDLAAGGVRGVAGVVTVLGSLPAAGVAVLVTALALAFARRPGDALALALGFVAVVVAVDLIKAGVGRVRPAGAGSSLTTASFPSGHAAYATAYTALAFTLLRGRDTGRAWRRTVLAGAVLLTLLIGLTRVVLDVHYLSDVVAGWALGAAIFGLVAVAVVAIGPMRNTAGDAGGSSREGSRATP